MAKFKIRKNLSDADMMRSFSEEETFETAVLSDEGGKRRFRSHAAMKKEAEKQINLPPEALDKLNRMLLEVSMEWLQSKRGDVDWKVTREGMSITLTPAPARKRGGQ